MTTIPAKSAQNTARDDLRATNHPTTEKVFLISLILVYFLSQLYIMTQYPMALDEAWFLDIAQEAGSRSSKGFLTFIFTQQNELGYGSAYWILYATLVQHLGRHAAFTTVRILVAVLFTAIFALLVAFSRDRDIRVRITLAFVWLTMPIAWWTGKVTGPEILSLFFLAVACYLALDNSPARFASLFAGIAAGIKINVLPVYCAILFWEIAKEPQKGAILRRLLGSAFLFGFGLILANPFLILNPAAFGAHLAAVSGAPFSYVSSIADLVQQFSKIAWNLYYEKDLALQGGYFQWGLSAGGFLVVLYALVHRDTPRRIKIAFWIASAFSLLMILSNGRYLGWYWFPLIVTQAFLLNKVRLSTLIVLGIVLLNLAFNASVIYHSIELKEELKTNIANQQNMKLCVMDHLQKHPTDQVIDMSEVIPSINSGIYYPCSVPEEEFTYTYVLGDRLMRFSAYQERFGDLLTGGQKRCAYTTVVTVREKCRTYIARLSDQSKLSFLEK